MFTCNVIISPAVRVVKFDALEHLMTRNTEKIEVINFWATWCKPCIKELPYFQDLQNQMADRVNITLISLDFVDVLNERVIPFVERRQLTPEVLLLDEIDYNSWIDKVDPSWSGAIPATLIINHQTGERKFHEGELKQGDIQNMVKELSN
ncbi:MAG: hypothetical protein DHS20C17_23720 [Cyclobacteriaceae bacterium]|nr:MAG: hypothetical protein DHS20C17_23720 [Cyclobacteriaceae bacterium]